MKRKILFVAVIMALLACVFAVTAYASEIPEWTSITEVAGMPDKSVFGNDGKSGATSRVLMSDGITYPAYYVCNNSTTLTVDVSTLNTKASKSYTKADIIRIEIPKGTVTISQTLSLSYGATGLVSVEIPYGVTTINQTAFRSTPISNAIVIPDSCTSIGAYSFKGTNISSVVIPSSVTSFGMDSFSECPRLSDVYCKCANIPQQAFYNDDNISTIKLENTVTIGKQAFCNPDGGILGITSLELPSTLTTIGQWAFTRTQIEVLVVPASVTTMSSAAFIGSTTLEKVVILGSVIGAEAFSGCTAIEELVLTENFTSFGSGAFGSTVDGKRFVTYYTGSDYNRIIELGSSTSRFSTAGKAEYIGYGNDKYTEKNYMVVWGANLCEVAFDGDHIEDSNPCVINCTRCGVSGVAEANPVHNDSVSIAYPNGFDKEGAKITGCSNEGCKHSTSVSLPAIFECLGYSTRNGDTGIATGFSVNYEALNAYKDLSQDTIGFGMVVFNPTFIGETFFDANGRINATKGAIQIEFSEGYSTFNAYVAGFDLSLESHQKLELVFAGYFYTKADKSDIELFQKEYAVSADPEKPNYSPMQSKITKGDAVAYTVKIQTVTTPTLVTTGKDGLDEYGA